MKRITAINNVSAESGGVSDVTRPNNVYGVARIVSDKFSPESSSSSSTSILTQELLSKSSRRVPVVRPFDQTNLKSLKDKIEAQKASRRTAHPVVRVEAETHKSFKKDKNGTTLVRKVASSAAPDAYLGFTSGTQTVRKTARPKPKIEEETPVTRKTATITTSSWRTNAKNARKMLKKEPITESKVRKEEKLVEPEVEKEDEKAELAENILSEDVKGILRELQLDPVVPEKPKKIKKIAPRPSAGVQPPTQAVETIERKRHYKSEDVQLYMQQRKQKRRLEELKKQEEERLNQAKREREMSKLKERQLKFKRRPPQKSKTSETKAISSGFDPYAKALAIIGGIGDEQDKSSSSNALSIPEYKSLPNNLKPEKAVDSSLFNEEEKPKTPEFEVELEKPKTDEKVEKLFEKPKIQKPFRNAEQSQLIEKLKARSQDIDQQTRFWTAEVEQLEKAKFERNLPGAQLRRVISPIQIQKPKTPEMKSPPTEPQLQAPQISQVQAPIENVMADIVTVERVIRPVTFVKDKEPDELNLVQLMYQKEKERRKKQKQKKRKKKPSTRESSYSASFHTENSEVTADFTDISNHTEKVKSASSKTVSSSIETVSNVENPIAESITDSVTQSFTKSASSEIRDSIQEDSIPDETESTKQSVKDSFSQDFESTKTSTIKSSIKSSKSSTITSSIKSSKPIPTESIDPSISESLTDLTSKVESTEMTEEKSGRRLAELIHDQLKQSEQVEQNLHAVEQAAHARFLAEMRQIQETGKHAAELMLKASKNIAKGVDVSDSYSQSKTITESVTTPNTVNTANTVPEYSIKSTAQCSSSLIQTSKIETTVPSTTQVEPTTQVDTTQVTTQIESKYSSVPTTTQVTSSKYTENFTEELTTGPLPPSESDNSTLTSKLKDDETEDSTDFDHSLTMLTPSVEHRERVKSEVKRKHADVTSSSDQEHEDSFVIFMKQMVEEYAQNHKHRHKVHSTMNMAKEKAKEKRKTTSAKKYKKNYDEKMVMQTESDNSMNQSSVSASDRVKKWLSKIPNEAALTKREQELQKRRKRAEKLLKWKRRLDEQEKSIIRIEEEAGQIKYHTESEVSTEKEPTESMQESITTNEDTTHHTTYSETDLDHSDDVIKVAALKDKLRKRQNQAISLRAKLGSTMDKENESLGKQEALRHQISRIDAIIAETKQQLSSASFDDLEGGLKPRIRSPSKDSSISSSSSHHASRLSTSKIKSSLPSESEASPRRMLPSSPKTVSASELSEEEEEIGEETHREETHPLNPNEVTEPISSHLEPASTCSTLTADKSHEVDTAGPVVEELLNRMVDELMSEIENPTAALKKLKGESIVELPVADEGEYFDTYFGFELEDSAIDKENVFLPMTAAEPAVAPSELDDDSLIRALLDHVERTDREEVQQPITPTTPRAPTFDQVQKTVSSYCEKLFTEPNSSPPVDADDFSVALFSLCGEIARNIKAEPFAPIPTKPWSKERFVPVSKFAKIHPESASELSSVIIGELRGLLSARGPVLDSRTLRKLGSRSKKDRVDLLLIGELREEESAWTRYEEDEDAVLATLTDGILDYLLDDTIQAMREVEQERVARA